MPITYSTVFEDGFTDTSQTELSVHVPTRISDDVANGSFSWTNTNVPGGVFKISSANRMYPFNANVYQAAGFSLAGKNNFRVTFTLHSMTRGTTWVGGVRFLFNGTTFYYIRYNEIASLWQLFFWTGSAFTSIGTLSASPAAGSDNVVVCTVTPNISDPTKQDITVTAGGSSVGSVTADTTNVATTNLVQINSEVQATDTTLWHFDNVKVETGTNAVATDFSITGPAQSFPNQDNTFTITMNNPAGGAESIALSDGGAGGTFTPTSLSFIAGDSIKTFVYHTPVGMNGDITLTATGSGQFAATHTATIHWQQIFAITDSRLFFSPGNWASDGAGAMQSTNIKAGSTKAMCPNVGYFKVAFSGTILSLQIDTSGNVSAGTSGNFGNVNIVIDDAAAIQSFPISPSTTRVNVTGLANGNHNAWVRYGTSQFSPDRWTNSPFGLTITGIAFDGVGNFQSLSGTTFAPLPGRCLALGDSWTEGTGVTVDMMITWAEVFGYGVQCEIGNSGYGSSSWGSIGFGVPGLPSSYNKIGSANTRDFSQLTMCVVVMGTNDTTLAASTVTTFLTNLRAQNAAMKIVLVVPPGSSVSPTAFANIQTALTTGFNNYQTAGLDPKCILVDVSSIFRPLVPGPSGAATWSSGDNLHPNDKTHPIFGALVAAETMRQFGTVSIVVTITVNGSGQPVVNWTADPNATGYKVYRSATKLADAVLLTTVGATTLSYTDTSPLTGAAYYEVVSTRT